MVLAACTSAACGRREEVRGMRRPDRIATVIVAALSLGGCAGQVEGMQPAGGGPDDSSVTPGAGGNKHPAGGLGGSPGSGGHDVVTPPPPADVTTPGPAALRRLTNLEYNNTLRDLLGVKPPNEENF